MTTIAQMRETLQGPRRHCDTWYGKQVMRRASIYLTWVFVRLKLAPNHASWVSLAAAIGGAVLLGRGEIGWGIVCINLWYLFDHVDGELARHYGRFSATGAYVDTVINFFVQPFTFFGFGWGLGSGRTDWIFVAGLLGAFGYVMLSVIPMLEDLIVLDTLNAKKRFLDKTSAKVGAPAAAGVLKKAFSFWHSILTFPNFLLTLTVFYIVLLFFDAFSRWQMTRVFIAFYAYSATAVWLFQLVQKICSCKADRRVAE